MHSKGEWNEMVETPYIGEIIHDCDEETAFCLNESNSGEGITQQNANGNLQKYMPSTK